MVQDAAALLWLVNLGVHRSQSIGTRGATMSTARTIYTSISILGKGAPFERVLEVAVLRA